MGFTIQIYCPDNDPTGIRIIERFNWTGVGALFLKEQFQKVAERKQFQRDCVYILIGHENLPDRDQEQSKIYVGQTSNISERLKQHSTDPNKSFWERTIVFTSSKGLNKANVLWLEQKLIGAARLASRCTIENGNEPKPPELSESEESDMQEFLKQMLETLPVIGIFLFEKGRTYSPNTPAVLPIETDKQKSSLEMVVVVPAQEEGFKRVFLGENSWYAVRISEDKIDKIKYIAAYQSAPISGVTHFAPVREIVPWGDEGKYKLIFSSPAQELRSKIMFDGKPGSMQGIRYTTLKALLKAKSTSELI